jgi:hypothetical protein
MPRFKRLPATGIALAVAIGMFAVGQTVLAAGTAPVGLGRATSFAVLAGTPAVTSTGPTIVNGNLGIFPAAAVTGFPPGTVNGAIHAADAVAKGAKNDLVSAYDDAAGRTPATTVAGGTLGGRTLVAGVYNAGGSTLDLTGTVTLNGQNNPNAVWIFQATSDLVTASASSVALINGAQPCNVFWQVTSSATLGSGSSFAGTILALTSITMASGVTMDGRALARNGDVTLIDDTITPRGCAAAVPPPTPTPVASPSSSATPTPTASGTSPAPSSGSTPAPSATPAASATAAPGATLRLTPTPIVNQPRVPLATPVMTLPPTDTAPLGDGGVSDQNFGGAMVALGGFLVLAAAWLVRTRPTRR